MVSRRECQLLLSTRTEETFHGELIGAPFVSSGQLIFTTGMVGYTESLTDPSYFGQILIFTYPLIGNYGVPSRKPASGSMLPINEGFESSRIHASAVVVAKDSPDAFHWKSSDTLDQWLKQEGVPGIVGIDTRRLVHLLRERPGLLGKIVPASPEGHRHPIDAGAGAGYFDPNAQNILPSVSVKEPTLLGKGRTRIALLDCGVKWSMIRQLIALDCEVQVLPWDSSLGSVDCSGWLLSNGPGDPTHAQSAIAEVSRLLEEDRPILGVCLGHQILALATGARTERMPYGHRSHNQPVVDVATRKGYLSSQNHGFHVVAGSLQKGWRPWFINANDQTIEGIRHETRPFRSVQFHPEAAGGPRETGWILQDFVKDARAQG